MADPHEEQLLAEARTLAEREQIRYWLTVYHDRRAEALAPSQQPFSEEDDRLVLDTSLTKAEIAAILHRSPAAIKKRRQKLRPEDWTEKRNG